jgi:hypothetical protein
MSEQPKTMRSVVQGIVEKYNASFFACGDIRTIVDDLQEALTLPPVPPRVVPEVGKPNEQWPVVSSMLGAAKKMAEAWPEGVARDPDGETSSGFDVFKDMSAISNAVCAGLQVSKETVDGLPSAPRPGWNTPRDDEDTAPPYELLDETKSQRRKSDILRQLSWMLVRPVVRQFAYHLEKVLQEHDWKGGWRHVTREVLLKRLEDEVAELDRALHDEGAKHDPKREAADVANFALMIWDLSRAPHQIDGGKKPGKKAVPAPGEVYVTTEPEYVGPIPQPGFVDYLHTRSEVLARKRGWTREIIVNEIAYAYKAGRTSVLGEPDPNEKDP